MTFAVPADEVKEVLEFASHKEAEEHLKGPLEIDTRDTIDAD